MTWAWYLLQVNIYVVIFYLFYKVFLDKETWFMLNRIYLLAAGTLSLLIPFIKPEWIFPGSANPGIIISAGQLDMLIANATIVPDNSAGMNWGAMIAIAYVCGTLIFGARLLFRLAHVGQLLKSNPAGKAFSFFSHKVIDSTLPAQATIHRHEEIHIRQFHTLDVIYLELLAILLWCNPVIYLYRNSIKNIHEYLADEEAAYFEGDKESYAMLLLSKAFGIDQNILTNSFFTQSLIKNRIYMLNKQRSRKTAILKYGLFVPLFAVTLLLSSAKISRNEDIKAVAEKITAPVPELFTALSGDKPATTFSGIPAEQDTTKKRRQTKPVKVRITAPSQDGSEGDGEKVYDFTSLDTPPSFPGGIEKFYQYLGAAVKYPKEAQDKHVQGKVFLSYTVEADGRIDEVKVLRGLGSGTDEEAVRILEASPKWIPGKIGNQAVRVKYNLPINFALSPGKTNEISVGKIPSVSPAGTKQEDGAGIYKISVVDNPKSPVAYVDGVKITIAAMQELDANTIESISVLKDETATNKYGEEAKNGVIEITTIKRKHRNTFSVGEAPAKNPTPPATWSTGVAPDRN